MIQPGNIVLLDFPQADADITKLRPALVIAQTHSKFDDWLVCMISSQVRQYVAGFDEIIDTNDIDFSPSGLKNSSVIRVSTLFTANKKRFKAATGEIGEERRQRIYQTLLQWIANEAK